MKITRLSQTRITPGACTCSPSLENHTPPNLRSRGRSRERIFAAGDDWNRVNGKATLNYPWQPRRVTTSSSFHRDGRLASRGTDPRGCRSDSLSAGLAIPRFRKSEKFNERVATGRIIRANDRGEWCTVTKRSGPIIVAKYFIADRLRETGRRFEKPITVSLIIETGPFVFQRS